MTKRNVEPDELPRRRMDGVIREVFLRPRATYEPDDVMRMFGINDRLFADLVDASTLRRHKGKISIGVMLRIVEEVFGLHQIERALGDQFEMFYDPLCRLETFTITAPRYVIAIAQYVMNDFETSTDASRDLGRWEQNIRDIGNQMPRWVDAMNYRQKAERVVKDRVE